MQSTPTKSNVFTELEQRNTIEPSRGELLKTLIGCVHSELLTRLHQMC